MPKASKDYNLKLLFPKLLAEWDHENNLKSPEDFSPNSHFKAWWICNLEHKWQATINSRTRGHGCPFCSGRIASPENNLTKLFPELLKEWDFKKNKTIKPSDFTKASSKEVWWICKNGHSWKSKISNRTYRNSGCPTCWSQMRGNIHRKSIVSKYGSLSSNFPDIAKEWNIEKNDKLKPDEIASKSSKKVWWVCRKGHEWTASISNRTYHNSGCPFCKGQTSKLEVRVFSELKYLFENVQWRKKISGQEVDIFISDFLIAIEVDGFPWHKDKMIQEKEKEQKLQKKGIILFRLRDSRLEIYDKRQIAYSNNHSLLEPIKNLIKLIINDFPSLKNKNIEKYLISNKFVNEDFYFKNVALFPNPNEESSFGIQFPKISFDWDFIKNFPIKPEQISYGSNKLYHWTCSKGHYFHESPKARIRSNGCKICNKDEQAQHKRNLTIAKNGSLCDNYPELKDLWSLKNKNPISDYSSGSHYKAFWECKYGHEWKAVIKDVASGSRCPECAPFKKTIKRKQSAIDRYNEIIKEWDFKNNFPKVPEDFTHGSGKLVWWICTKKNNYQAKINNRTSNNSNCPFCTGRKVSVENSFKINFPDLLQEWDALRNKRGPEEFISGSHYKAWWKCKNGHSWNAEIRARTQKGKQCPECRLNNLP